MWEAWHFWTTYLLQIQPPCFNLWRGSQLHTAKVCHGKWSRVNFKYQIEQSALAHIACKCDVYVGTTWLKSTKFQQRITRNITEKFTHRLKEIFELLEREVLFASQQDGVISEKLAENVLTEKIWLKEFCTHYRSFSFFLNSPCACRRRVFCSL